MDMINNMNTTEICLCILIIAGAIACIALTLVLFNLKTTLKKLNKVLDEVDTTMDNVQNIVVDVEGKLKKLDAPIKAGTGIINDGFIKIKTLPKAVITKNISIPIVVADTNESRAFLITFDPLEISNSVSIFSKESNLFTSFPD